MFDLFKNKPSDVKAIRNGLLQFIKEQLQKNEGGEGRNIRVLNLFITCSEAEKHLYEAAVFFAEEDRFKNEEVQRIADDYAIELPPDWQLNITFIQPAPAEAINAAEVDAALFIATRTKSSIHTSGTAYLRLLKGETEKQWYTLTSSTKKITMGRERKVQTADGFFRENIICFPGQSKEESNRSVSRQHAHIEWDAHSGCFVLHADEGGIPPLNKTKVRKLDGTVEKIQTIEIGHRLQEGDQIMLGESAILEFTYNMPE